MESMAGEKNALVLSAGGLYCAWQAGAYQAISRYLRPDLVVGASAGALNGWPIAGGCSPETLIERWLDPTASDLLRLIPKPGLAKGYFDPAPLRLQTEKIVAEFQPLIPYGLTLVELPRLRTVLVQHPNITARHLQATCAIPFLLPPVRIGSRRYVDGGLIEKLPVHAAVQMGATRIIALDCLPPIDIWWIRLGARTVSIFKSRRPVPSHVQITIISPSEPLGDTNSAVFWNRKNIERWIALGFHDAAQVLRTQPTWDTDTGRVWQRAPQNRKLNNRGFHRMYIPPFTSITFPVM
jgi:NTE family protein